jgi:hypothetical protein
VVSAATSVATSAATSVAASTTAMATAFTATMVAAAYVTAALMANWCAAGVIELGMMAPAAPVVFPRMVDDEGGIIAPSTPSI